MREPLGSVGAWLRTVLAVSSQRAAHAYRAGLPHLVAATVAISGLAYIQQLAIAGMLPPSDFGVVRTTEALLLVLLLIGACGMPTAAVRFVPELEPDARGVMLRRLLRMTLVVSSTLAALTGVATLLFPGNEVAGALRGVVWVIVFAAMSRVIYNYHQGILRVRGISGIAALLAMTALGCVVGGVALFGRDGWVVGRVVGEAVFLVGLLLAARASLRERPSGALPAAYDTGVLLRFGFTVTLSFALRSGMDASGLFVLHAMAAPAEQTGFFGLGTLLVTALLMFPAGFGALLLPRLVMRRARQTATRKYLLWAVGWSVALTLPLTLAGIILLPWVLPAILPAYRDGVAIVTVLLCIAPLRALAAMAGNQLLAASQIGATIALNGSGLLLFVPLAVLLADRMGVMGVVLASLLAEAALASAVLVVALRSTRARAAVGHEAFALPVA